MWQHIVHGYLDAAKCGPDAVIDNCSGRGTQLLHYVLCEVCCVLLLLQQNDNIICSFCEYSLRRAIHMTWHPAYGTAHTLGWVLWRAGKDDTFCRIR